MATDVRSSAQFATTTADADWRAFATAIEAGLLAVGATKLAGPPQMDLATVAAPAAGSLAAGYHYWQLNDPKAATRPVCFRLGYGRASTADRFRLSHLVAQSFNAAGATVGWAMTAETLAIINSLAASTPTFRTYHGRYGLWWGLAHPNGLTYSIGFSILRSWGGADFGDLLIKTAWSSSTPYTEYADLAKLIAGGRTTASTQPGMHGAPDTVDGGMPLVGSDAGIFPGIINVGRVEPVPGIVVMRATDVGAGTFQVDMLGEVRNYIQLASAWPIFAVNGSPVVGLVWE